ncbi:restriction endonuclease [candidate division TA06 bacterium]|nr:restriction endonuclease [candidate division TA06 bacterium]
MDWKQYEQEISDYFRSEYPTARITPDTKVTGRFSKVDRQLDLLIEDRASDFEFRIVVDGKYRDKRIDVNDVEAFLGLLRDVSAHKGVMISTEGYSQAAINRAHYDDLDLELDILNFKELGQFHAFGAITYAGGHGVLLPAPFGWVIDGTRRKGIVACLYQRGLDLEAAGSAREWMYINFWSKDETASDLESLFKHQEGYLRKQFPGAEIQYADTVKRSDAKTKLRILNVVSYPTPEYTGFVEFEKFIFFCVLFTPKELEKKNLRKLSYILRRVLPLEIKQ